MRKELAKINRVVNSRFSVLLGERKKRISTVSKDTGVSRTTLTNLYYGKGSAISFDVLSKLCTYFDCSIEDIIDIEREGD